MFLKALIKIDINLISMKSKLNKKYQIYGIGAALVDIEVVLLDAFLQNNGTEKGVVTPVDESRQAELLNAFTADQHHLMKWKVALT